MIRGSPLPLLRIPGWDAKNRASAEAASTLRAGAGLALGLVSSGREDVVGDCWFGDEQPSIVRESGWMAVSDSCDAQQALGTHAQRQSLRGGGLPAVGHASSDTYVHCIDLPVGGSLSLLGWEERKGPERVRRCCQWETENEPWPSRGGREMIGSWCVREKGCMLLAAPCVDKAECWFVVDLAVAVVNGAGGAGWSPTLYADIVKDARRLVACPIPRAVSTKEWDAFSARHPQAVGETCYRGHLRHVSRLGRMCPDRFVS